MLVTPHQFKGIKLLTRISIMTVCSPTNRAHCIRETFKVKMTQDVTWQPSAHHHHNESVVTQTSSHSGIVTLLRDNSSHLAIHGRNASLPFQTLIAHPYPP